jgi:type VI protein secretion system component Hcp
MFVGRRSTAHSRSLVSEPLEPRQLLAGFVQVDLVDADLFVQGDELANVFTIEQVADPAGGPSSLRVVPDGDTSINELPAGMPLDLGPVAVVNVNILPGDGADMVGVDGLSVDGRLKIENHGGTDIFGIQGTRASKLDMSSAGSQSKATLSDVTIERTFDKSSPKLYQPICTGKNVSTKMTVVRCHGAAKLEYDDSPGSVDLEGVEIDGGLTVVSSAGLSQLTVAGSSLGASIDKSTPILMLRTSDTKVEMTGSEVHGAADLKFSQGGGAVQLDTVHIDGGLSISSGGETSQYLMIHMKKVLVSSLHAGGSSTMGHGLSVKSSQPLDFTAEETTTAGPYYLKFGDIKGEARSSVNLSSFAVGGSLRIESTGPLDLTAQDGDTAGPVFIKIEDIKGEAQNSVSLTSFQVGGSLRVESHGPLNLTARDTTAAAFDMFLKVGDVAGEARDESQASTVDLSNLQIGGNLRLLTGAGQETVRLDGLHVAGRTQIALGGGDDSLSVVDSIFEGFALLDGGRDDDLLSLMRVDFQDGSRIVHWEAPPPGAASARGRSR